MEGCGCISSAESFDHSYNTIAVYICQYFIPDEAACTFHATICSSLMYSSLNL